MRIHRKPGRLRAVIAAVVLTIGGLAGVTVSAQPAAAAASCHPSVQNVIPGWNTVQPAGPSRGITLCEGFTAGLPGPDAFVQIVDLSAGAKVQLIADPCDINSSCGPRPSVFPNRDFHVRTAADWANWIPGNISSPAGSKLYSVSNAGFFTNTSGAPTALSLPWLQWKWDANSFFAVGDPGWAFNHNTDRAWDTPKRAITFGDPATTPQEVHMFDFPTVCSDPTCNHYTSNDLNTAPYVNDGQYRMCNSNPCWDATVAFKPNFVIGSPLPAPQPRRTYVGVSPSGTGAITKVYILNSVEGLTNAQAQAILESFGSQLETQLDGGGSTQLWGNGGANLINASTGRAVPQVLAVYGS